jgi:hypothetical protein
MLFLFTIYPKRVMFDPMSELSGDDQEDIGVAPAKSTPAKLQRSSAGSSGNGSFAKELHSVTIHARQRTFYIDLKESGHGKFFKISEKSRGGQKTTIMFDSEDLEQFISAFQEMKPFV